MHLLSPPFLTLSFILLPTRSFHDDRYSCPAGGRHTCWLDSTPPCPIGLALIYGVMKIVNLAHAGVYDVGRLCGFCLDRQLRA